MTERVPEDFDEFTAWLGMGHAEAVTPEAPGWIYFMQDTFTASKIKIGWALDVAKRRKALQTGAAGQLFVIAVMPGDVKREKEIQRKFSHLHYRGEWFNYTGEIAEFIEANARTLTTRGDGFVMRPATESGR